jgi:hypothetical protein
MLRMRAESEAQAAQRRALLAPVARLCERAGVPVRLGQLERPPHTPVVALVCEAADGAWNASVTVVKAQPIATEHQTWNSRWGRDPELGYDLNTPGQLVFEVQIHEDDDGAGGHGPRPLVVFELLDDAEATADSLTLWWRRPSLFHTQVPAPDQRVEQRRRQRVREHRRSAAAAPDVRIADLPPEASASVTALDRAALAWHFPRERGGRFRRKAVVALTPLDDLVLHVRRPWLVARADAGGLVVTTQDVIGGNQEHRWNRTPWLWDSRHAGTPAAQRWQLDDADEARPVLDLLSEGAMAQALALAGVRVDDQIAKLLDGCPTRHYRAALTEKWVRSLHAGLAESAPWRFAAAHRVWRSERTSGARRPAVLFGLKGLNQQRKPKLALDLADGEPLLRLIFTASNLALPRSLWTVPADLD